jgi:anti-sigma B factor antagonist
MTLSSTVRSRPCECTVSVRALAGVVVLTVAGELDAAAAPLLRRHLLCGPHPGRILLDLGDVTFIDSVGLRTLLEAALAGEPIELVRRSHAVERILELTGTRDLLCG